MLSIFTRRGKIMSDSDNKLRPNVGQEIAEKPASVFAGTSFGYTKTRQQSNAAIHPHRNSGGLIDTPRDAVREPSTADRDRQQGRASSAKSDDVKNALIFKARNQSKKAASIRISLRKAMAAANSKATRQNDMSSINLADTVFKDAAFMKGVGNRDSDEHPLLNPDAPGAGSINMLLSFKNSDDEKQYRQLMKRQIYAPLIPVMAIIAILVSTHAIFEGLFTSGPIFIVGFVTFFLAAMMFSLVIMAHVSVAVGGMAPGTTRYKVTDYIIFRLFGGEIESIVNVSCALAIGFYLVGRVLTGPCTDTEKQMGNWNIMKCNPEGNSSALPSDTTLMLYLLPVACQIYLKGVSRVSMVLSWLIASAFYIACAEHLHNDTLMWFAIYSICFLSISYEMERYKRAFFLQSKQALKDAIAAEREHFEQEHHMMTVTQEKETIEKEHEFMRSLIGNVAHDLKTPLQSMRMDIEALRAMFVNESTSAQQQQSALPSPAMITSAKPENNHCHSRASFSSSGGAIGGGGGGGDDGRISNALSAQKLDMITSLNVACSFMQMAINRAIDYTKASRNIALVPKIESFPLLEVIESQVAMINHMQSSLKILVESLPDTISTFVLSDRHWLAENLLCLLSNAVKYSDGGTVRVLTDILDDNGAGGAGGEDASKPSSLPSSTPSSVVPAMAVLRDALLRQPTALVSSPYSRKSHYLKITVEDTGIGLSEAERAALFQPFKQAQRYTGGTGLGLFSLSKRVDALGGSYGVTGRSDGLRGSAFWFTIPYRPDKSLTPSAAALMRSGRVTAKVSTNNSRCESPEHRIPGSGTAAAAASTTGNNIAAVHNYTNSNNNNNSNNHGIRKRTQFESVLTPVFSPNVNMVGPIEATVESPQNLLPITGLRVLIVDDALTILKVSGKHIEQAGHIVETAKNGFIGLNRMTESLLAQRKSRSMAEDGLLTDEKGDDDVEAADVKNKILDLVLMDLQMPVMDGIEAVRRYRAIEQQQALQDPSHDLLLLPSNASFPLSEQQKPLAELPSSSAEAILALRRSSAAEDYTHATAGGGAGDDGTKPLIIVGMSANSDAESKRLAKEAGMNYFLDKPFTIADFNLVLQRIYMKEHHASGDDDGEHFSAPSSPAFTILSEH